MQYIQQVMNNMTSWKELKDGILNDELPKNRTKYVRYSNLEDINKKMVIYYLKKGLEILMKDEIV